MGNRAVVFFGKEEGSAGTYLHWNGGPESVLAFLAVMEDRKWTRIDYAQARFSGIVVEFFDTEGDDEGMSVGSDSFTGEVANHDQGDNGVYFVTREAQKWLIEQHVDGQVRLWDLTEESLKQLGLKAQEYFSQIRNVLKELRDLRIADAAKSRGAK